AAVPLRPDRLRGPARGEARAEPLQRADRSRDDDADRLAGAAERVRGPRPRAVDRGPAAVRVLWIDEPRRDARVDGAADERRIWHERARARGRRHATAQTGRIGA